MSCVPLKDLKASNPIELEYAVANNIEEEPAFKWWVKNTLRNRDRIISKVKAKYWRTTPKFGIEVPKSVNEAYAIDRLTGTTLWTDSINKELKNIRIAFDELEGVAEEEIQTGFDIKMDGKFTRKARLVADGQKTNVPSSIIYSSVVSRESVR